MIIRVERPEVKGPGKTVIGVIRLEVGELREVVTRIRRSGVRGPRDRAPGVKRFLSLLTSLTLKQAFFN